MPGVATLTAFADQAQEALAAAREEIDALNVYPVPDGDTGTNMFLTFEAARSALLAAGAEDLPASLAAFARGALLGARGNSGVISAQIVGAFCRRLAEAGPADRLGSVFAEGMVLATRASYAAVGTPVEGTILSVAKAASRAAEQAACGEPGRVGEVVRAAAAAAREALDRTPDQLATLRAAGVVDAGGRALCVLLDALETTVTGHRAVSEPARLGSRTIPVPTFRAGDLTADGPSYEVMFLLDADDDRVPALRSALAPLGDSLVVVGGDRLWNVHVHVDDVGAVLEAGIAAGRPYRIRVTHFADQADRAAPARTGRRVVVLAAGPGLRDLFEQAGALVVPTGSGRRPSTGEILAAIRGTGAAEVVVLPNDRASLAAAEAAAQTARQEEQIRVGVVPTSAQVQGLAALAVHEPGRDYESDVLEMTAAARHARSGAVTVAARRAMTMAGPCEAGDVLGVVEGDFVVVGADLFTVATEVLERLLGGGGELVTLVAGAVPDEEHDLARRCADHLAEARPGVDVVVYDGGQARYPLLVGVE